MGESRRSKIWKRTLVGSALALGLTGLLFWANSNPWVLVVVPALLTVGACVELERMLPGRGGGLVLLPGVVAGVVLGARTIEGDGAVWPDVYTWVGALAAVASAVLWRAPARVWRSLWLGLWIVAPLFCLLAIERRWGMSGLVALLILSKVGDIAGYYVGNAIGRSHPFPTISPGKTTEGCLGSLAFGTLAGAVLAWQGVLPGAWWAGAVAGALVNLAAQAGDLLESVLKRRSAVKDSGTWFGPSGGVLDVVDSLLTTLPVALILWPVLLNG